MFQEKLRQRVIRKYSEKSQELTSENLKSGVNKKEKKRNLNDLYLRKVFYAILFEHGSLFQ